MMWTRKQLRELVDIASDAGDAIMEVYDGDHGVQLKADESPLTLADLASNQCLTEGLQAAFPDISVVSEEANEGVIPDRCFLLDPLDGTKEFIKKNGEFTVNIAVIEGQKPIAGVVHAPAIGRTFVGGPEGAWEVQDEWQPIAPTDHEDNEPYLIVGSRSHPGPDMQAHIEALEAAGKSVEVVPMGSSLKLCLVACGEAHEYPRLGPTMPWDTAAAQAICEAAGATVLDPRGDRLSVPAIIVRNQPFIVSC